MTQDGWTTPYHAAVLETDPIVFQQRIREAKTAILERLSELPLSALTPEQREELHELCDARRTLDLLEKSSPGLPAAS